MPPRDERPDDEVTVADTEEKISFLVLQALQQRLESTKQQHRLLRKNEPTMSSLEVDQALRSLYADLETLIEETLGYATTRGKRRDFVKALHAARREANGDRDAEIGGVWRTVQEYLERMSLLLKTYPMDQDFIEDIKQMLTETAVENYKAKRDAKEQEVADGVESL